MDSVKRGGRCNVHKTRLNFVHVILVSLSANQ